MNKLRKWVAALAALTMMGVVFAGAPATATQETPPPQNITCDGAPEVRGFQWQLEQRTRDTIPAVEEVSHLVYSYEKDVADFLTRHQYRKEVRGEVWQRDNGQHTWHKTGQTFDWTWWEPASLKWSFTNPAVLESGPHNGVVKEWTQGNGHKHWRWISTQYRYVPNGVTEEIPNGSHTELSGETLEVLPAPWVLLDGYPVEVVTQEAVPASFTPWSQWVAEGDVVRTETNTAPDLPAGSDVLEYRWADAGTYVISEAVPPAWQDDDANEACYNGAFFLEASHTVTCGGVDLTLRNVSPWVYPLSVEISRDHGATWGEHTYGPVVDNRTDGKLNGPAKDQTKARTLTFEEDSGPVSIRYRVQAGSESDLYVGLPVGEWTVVPVVTDCEPPMVDGTVEVTYTQWVASDLACGDEEVTLTRSRTTTVTTYKVIGEPGAWEVVVDEVTSETVTETTTRDLTVEEREQLLEDCTFLPPPPEEPTPDPTPSPEPTPDPTPDPEPTPAPEETPVPDDELAVTGAGSPAAAGFWVALLVALGTILVAGRRWVRS